MNPLVPKIIPAIVAAVSKQGGYTSKTKLIKLLYLWDVEFCRTFGHTITHLDWTFLHLGPWTGEIDAVITTLCAEGILKVRKTAAHDTDLLYSDVSPDTDSFFRSIKEAAPLRKVLHLWASAETRDILDHVYFQTEPMQWGVRGKTLDFSVVRIEEVPKYMRAASGISKGQLESARRAFLQKRESSKKEGAVRFTPPRYDDEFAAAIAQLNSPER